MPHSFVIQVVLLGMFVGTFQLKTIDEALWEIFTYSTTLKPGTCKCVPFYLCSENNTVITDGRGLLDLRANENEGPCTDYMDRCCTVEKIETKPIVPNDKKKRGCGWRNKDGVGFRLKGDKHNETKFGEFPWTVAILQQEKIGELEDPLIRYQCSGSLVHPQAIITAAHCVNDSTKSYIVRVGEWDTQTTKEIYPCQDREVISITIHPKYVATVLFYDIAFAVLDSPIDMSYPNVGVACLHRQRTVVASGTRCFATGWGKNFFGDAGTYQVILKKIELPIVGRAICQRNLRKTRLGKYFTLHESFICAGGEEDVDTCTGDGGGPLVCPIPGQEERYEQVGIVAWGIGCGSKNVPGVYANVAFFRDWINKQIAQNNFDTNTYEY